MAKRHGLWAEIQRERARQQRIRQREFREFQRAEPKRAVRRPRLSATKSGRLLPMNGNGRGFTSRTARPRRQPWPKTSGPALPNSTGCSRRASVTSQSSRSRRCGGLTPTRHSTQASLPSHRLPRCGSISSRHRRPDWAKSLAAQAASRGSSSLPAQLTPGRSNNTRPPRPTGGGNWRGSVLPTMRPPPSLSTMLASTSSAGTAGRGILKLSHSSALSSWTRPYTRRDFPHQTRTVYRPDPKVLWPLGIALRRSSRASHPGSRRNQAPCLPWPRGCRGLWRKDS